MIDPKQTVRNEESLDSLELPHAGTILVESDRLRVRRTEYSDLPTITKVFGNPEMMEDLGGVQNFIEHRITIDRWHKNWGNDLDYCGILESVDGADQIGTASIHPSTISDLDGVEISYMVLPEFQRQGFALEISKELVGHALKNLGVERVIISTHPDNQASREIASALEFRDLGVREHARPFLADSLVRQIYVLEREA